MKFKKNAIQFTDVLFGDKIPLYGNVYFITTCTTPLRQQVG